MIAHLQRAHHTANLLTYLYGPGERRDQSDPRVVAGDCHGAPIDQLSHTATLPELAQALNGPVARLGTSAPKQPVWVCSVRSDPRYPDPTDAQWADVAHRLAAVTVAPDGDADACRWIALRNQPQQLYVVATLAREDGSLHNPYRDAFLLQRECHRIAAELGHRPATPEPKPPVTENVMPLTVTITTEPSGSVVARGGDSLAVMLLDRAGFPYINDWHGPRHRLPTSMPRGEQAVIASHAAEMLRAARYAVEIDPQLDTRSAAGGMPSLGPQLLEVTDRIRGAESGADLADALDSLLHPEHGALERVREALEAASEQITDIDDEAYQLADRFGFANDFLSAAQSELAGMHEELRRIAPAPHDEPMPSANRVHNVASAARATSPHSAPAAGASSAASTIPPPVPPGQGPAARAR